MVPTAYIGSLQSLADMSVPSWIDFYCYLFSDLQQYHIDLVPFDAIVLRWGYLGLCLPFVGDNGYLPMARALYNVLQHLLPTENITVCMCNGTYSGSTYDGYCWLHGIMAQVIPGFSTSVPAVPPTWSKVKDIPHFAKLYNIYYGLLTLQRVFNTDLSKSLAFLSAIQEETLRPSIIILETSLTSYNNNRPQTEFDDLPGSLPPHYQIDGLAQSLVRATMPLAPATATGTYFNFATSFTGYYYNPPFRSQPPLDLGDYPATFGPAIANAMVRRPYSQRKCIGDNSTGPPQQGGRYQSPTPSTTRRPTTRPARATAAPADEYCDNACSERHPTVLCNTGIVCPLVH